MDINGISDILLGHSNKMSNCPKCRLEKNLRLKEDNSQIIVQSSIGVSEVSECNCPCDIPVQLPCDIPSVADIHNGNRLPSGGILKLKQQSNKFSFQMKHLK